MNGEPIEENVCPSCTKSRRVRKGIEVAVRALENRDSAIPGHVNGLNVHAPLKYQSFGSGVADIETE